MPPVLKPPPGMSLTELAAKGVGQLTAPPEKPHTTVYVGKIAPTIEDDFLRALLEVCMQEHAADTYLGFMVTRSFLIMNCLTTSSMERFCSAAFL
jgi:hypothetical protein